MLPLRNPETRTQRVPINIDHMALYCRIIQPHPIYYIFETSSLKSNRLQFERWKLVNLRVVAADMEHFSTIHD